MGGQNLPTNHLTAGDAFIPTSSRWPDCEADIAPSTAQRVAL